MICDSQNVETEDRNSENETKTTRLTGGGGCWRGEGRILTNDLGGGGVLGKEAISLRQQQRLDSRGQLIKEKVV